MSMVKPYSNAILKTVIMLMPEEIISIIIFSQFMKGKNLFNVIYVITVSH